MLKEITAHIKSLMENEEAHSETYCAYEEVLKYLLKKSGPVNKRKSAFYESLVPYLDKYDKLMLRGFYDYWSETDRAKRPKMRFEKEKTWELDKRLARWYQNNFEDSDKKSGSFIGERKHG